MLSLVRPCRVNLSYIFNAKGVITDSGGIQEETAYLNIPCCVIRKNTERPITLDRKNAKLIKNIKFLKKNVYKIFNFKSKKKIKFWDGYTALRIFNIIKKLIN